MAHKNAYEQIGKYSYALSVVTPIAVFSSLNLRYIYVADNNKKFEFIHYWALRVILFIAFGLILYTFSILWFENVIVLFLILGVFCYKAFEAMSDMFFATHHKAERNKYISRSIVIRSVLIFAAFTICFSRTKNIEMSLVFIILSYIFSFFLIDYKGLPEKEKNEITPLWSFFTEFKKKDFRCKLSKLFFIGLPMGISSLIYSLIVVVPRFFIDTFIGVEELGFFSAIYYLFSALLLVSIAFADASMPRFVKLYHVKNVYQFKKLLFSYLISVVIIFLIGSCIIYYAGDTILALAYGSDFRQFRLLFLYGFIVTAIEVMSKFVFTALTSIQYLKHQAVIQLCILVIIFFECYFFRNDLTLKSIVLYQGIAFGVQLFVAIFFLYRGLNDASGK
jgi:O-antigen/teichoic acid export membrane protein